MPILNAIARLIEATYRDEVPSNEDREAWRLTAWRARQEYDALRARADKAEAEVATLRAAIEGFFRPGPGVAMPARYEPDFGESCNITWNRKLDALAAALAPVDEKRTKP